MKVLSVFIYPQGDMPYAAQATIEVDGLGEVKIKHALSAELIAMVNEQAIIALRKALGQVIETPAELKS